MAYYDLLAARRELLVITQGYDTALHMHEVARARADAGLGMPLDTDLAAAKVASLREQLALASGTVKVAESRLASTLGLDPTAALPEVTGELSPMAVPDGLQAAANGAARPTIRRQATTTSMPMRWLGYCGSWSAAQREQPEDGSTIAIARCVTRPISAAARPSSPRSSTFRNASRKHS